MPIYRKGSELVVSSGRLATSVECCDPCPPDAPNCHGGFPELYCCCVDWCCAIDGVTFNGQYLPYKTLDEWGEGPQPCNCVFGASCAGAFAAIYGELSLDGSYDDDKYVFLNFNLTCTEGVASVQGNITNYVGLAGSVTGISYGTVVAPVAFDCDGAAVVVGDFEWVDCLSGDCEAAPPLQFHFASSFPCNPLP